MTHGWASLVVVSIFADQSIHVLCKCTCLFQGRDLPADVYNNFPASDPGKYKRLSSIAKYGTMCAAWDVVPGTPFQKTQCSLKADFTAKEHNWCQVPWCYVDESCEEKTVSVLFNGSQAQYFSYAACDRQAADCFSDGPIGTFGEGNPKCPYDPYRDRTYRVYVAKGACGCLYHGSTLPRLVVTEHPSQSPGKYKDLPHIELYGTTCAAWDQSPNFPWYSYCPRNANWCGYEYNWCQLPWCYVDGACPTAVPSVVFRGSRAMFYSYETCRGTPDCYTFSGPGEEHKLPATCPFDSRLHGWSTASTCLAWAKTSCDCMYQGEHLPEDLLRKYPLSNPGAYYDVPASPIYGTTCAPWDTMPGTPFHSSCLGGLNFSLGKHNWCQVPWCYVRPNCDKKSPSTVFEGSDVAWFSYQACGRFPDCYADGPDGPYGAGVPGCPFDPYKDKSYRIFKSSCPCKFQGQTLPPEIVEELFGSRAPNVRGANLYGTNCAAWDQIPDLPFYNFCPRGANFCGYEYNWCQAPWCFVDGSCDATRKTILSNSTLFYSYDTCLETPNCYSGAARGKTKSLDVLPSACPFDSSDNGWSVQQQCPKGHLTTDCSCIFQGKDLPSSLLELYPLDDPGKYKDYPAVGKYGTMCAAWDTVPGTPWQASLCPPEGDYSSPYRNWCQVPWCYVGEACDSRIESNTFGGRGLFYSYAACGNAPPCTQGFAPGTPGCPYDPHGEKTYRIFKSSCKCQYHGRLLPESLLTEYPPEQPGRYQNAPYIRLYGTTCAAWDASPNFPFFSSCPSNSDWCDYDHNYCQAPWCYVDTTCASAIPSSVFSSLTALYSYETCLNTPDCFTNSKKGQRYKLPAACPFDDSDGWASAANCSNGYTVPEEVSIAWKKLNAYSLANVLCVIAFALRT